MNRTDSCYVSCSLCVYYSGYYCDKWGRDIDAPHDSACKKFAPEDEVISLINDDEVNNG